MRFQNDKDCCLNSIALLRYLPSLLAALICVAFLLPFFFLFFVTVLCRRSFVFSACVAVIAVKLSHFDARVVAMWFGVACRISVAVFDLQVNRVCWHKCICFSAVLRSLSQFPSRHFGRSWFSPKTVLRTEFVNSRHLSKERKREREKIIWGQ